MLRSYCISSTLLRRFCSASSLTVKETLVKKPVNQKILVQGWVQAVRKYKELFFVDLIDGTCLDRLQILINAHNVKPPNYGSSMKVQGSVVESSHPGQEIELIADSWEALGACDESYPFENHKKYSSEYIRQYPHLRPRTRRFSSILRIRNHASMAVHNFFQNEGFCFIHTPIITQNDCEGAGEVFTVEVKGKLADTLLDKNDDLNIDSTRTDQTSAIETGLPCSNVNNNISQKHFFGVPTFLTVSGQLHLESIACALTRVYNFGPTFRADPSRTRMHANEFQMIEAEIAFVRDVDELMKIVETCLKKVAETIMQSCPEEVKFIVKDVKNYDHYIDSFLTKPFVRMSYKDAISILQRNNESLKTPIEFGDDFATEHKQFIVKYCDNVPVFISMFPSTIKPFYTKSDENDMACCFDVFAAYGGEICGGSIREDNEENLKKKYSFENTNLSWYLDLRKYGTVPHGGFGIGFERLLQSILGIPNIRDIIPFPRRKHDCKC